MSRTALGVFLLSSLALVACIPQPRLENAWPGADSERTAPRPEVRVVWPLTGRPAPDAKTAASRLVVVPVRGTPAGAALPGLEGADVVYETPAGSESRFAAVFQSMLPAACGPVAAAAPGDAVIAAQYAAGLAHTGAPVPLDGGAVDIGQRARAAAYRGSGAGVFADVASLASAGGTASPPALTFGAPRPNGQGAKVAAVDVPFGTAETVEWRWDVGAAAFTRTVGGKPQAGAGGARIRATNVVVMWARPSQDTSGGLALVDTGRASFFMDGRRFSGTWKAAADAPPVLLDDSGSALALVPGDTWFEVVPTAVNITLR